jgi:hypothetical protein
MGAIPAVLRERIDTYLRDRMVELVERMLDLHKRLPSALMHDRDRIQTEIDATDRQIDDLVYRLYGLSDKEIKLVESDAKRSMV